MNYITTSNSGEGRHAPSHRIPLAIFIVGGGRSIFISIFPRLASPELAGDGLSRFAIDGGAVSTCGQLDEVVLAGLDGNLMLTCH